MKKQKDNIKKELTYEELMLLPEKQLNALFLETRSKIINGKRIKKDTTEIEINNCYIIKAIEDKD